jgi:hypothetical protein
MSHGPIDHLSRRLQDLNMLQMVQPARHIAQGSHLELASHAKMALDLSNRH